MPKSVKSTQDKSPQKSSKPVEAHIRSEQYLQEPLERLMRRAQGNPRTISPQDAARIQQSIGNQAYGQLQKPISTQVEQPADTSSLNSIVRRATDLVNNSYKAPYQEGRNGKRRSTQIKLTLQPNTTVLQRAFLDIQSHDFAGYIEEQKTKQSKLDKNDSPFTTVGFEHEFTQTEGENKLAGISHVELAKSSPLPYTKLPFILETDAANALELVSPPYLIKTLKGTIIPDPSDVETVDNLIKKDLLKFSEAGTIGNMVTAFKKIGIDFSAVEGLKIETKNLSHKSKVMDYSDDSNANLNFEELKDIKIKPTEKGGGITSQVNFATDAETFDKFQEINKESQLELTKGAPGFNPKAIIATLEEEIKKMIGLTGIKLTPNLTIFRNQLARTLGSQFAVPAIKAVKQIQGDIFHGANLAEDPGKEAFLKFSAYLSSAVKDVHGTWIKDSLMNIGLGLLNDEEWQTVRRMLKNEDFRLGISKLTLPEFTNINGFEGKHDLKKGNQLVYATLQEAKSLIIEALDTIDLQINWVLGDERPTSHLGIVPTKSVGFMEHNKGMITPRQDTFIDPRKAQIPEMWEKGKRLHVVETRKDSIESLYKLGLKSGELDKDTLIKLARELDQKIQQADSQIKGLILKDQELDEKIPTLIKERKGNEIEILKLEKEKDGKIKQYKETYLKENNEEPSKSNLSKYEKGLDKDIIKLKKRQTTIAKLIEKLKTDLPKRKQNIKESIEQLSEEIKGYILEHKEIEKQISEK